MLTNSSSLLQAGAGRRVYCTGSGRGPCGWQAPCDATLHVQPQPSRVRGGYATPPPPAPRPHVHSLSPVGAGGDVPVTPTPTSSIRSLTAGCMRQMRREWRGNGSCGRGGSQSRGVQRGFCAISGAAPGAGVAAAAPLTNGDLVNRVDQAEGDRHRDDGAADHHDGSVGKGAACRQWLAGTHTATLRAGQRTRNAMLRTGDARGRLTRPCPPSSPTCPVGASAPCIEGCWAQCDSGAFAWRVGVCALRPHWGAARCHPNCGRFAAARRP